MWFAVQNVFIWSILTCVYLIHSVFGVLSPRIVTFDVKPGGVKHEFVENWEGFQCKFVYVAQGGTHEEWLLTLGANGDQTEWVCTIERPGGSSYLFFEKFSVQVSGARLENVVVQSGPEKQLNEDEVEIKRSENIVKSRQGKFNSQMSKIEVHATSGKREL